MKSLPPRPNLDHLKKQAKDLLRAYRNQDADAIARLRVYLPAAVGKDPGQIEQLDLRLHDAQSCIAREHGFASWLDLKTYVEVQNAAPNLDAWRMQWLKLVYAGDVTGGFTPPHPAIAARMLQENPDFARDDPYSVRDR